MSITLQAMTFSALSPMKRLHYSRSSGDGRSCLGLLSTLQNMSYYRRNHSSNCLIRRNILYSGRNVLGVISNSSINNRSSSSTTHLQASHLIRNLTNSSGNRNYYKEHSGIKFAVRHSSINSKEKDEEDENENENEKNRKSANYERILTNNSSSNNSNNNRSNEKTIILDTENDKYFYLIKQKYSPSRHQKYRQNVGDGSLEKTISNKPLNERIIQSYADVVAYFMPKGRALKYE